MKTYTAKEMSDRTATYTIPPMAATNIVIDITNGCKYCKGTKTLLSSPFGNTFKVLIGDGTLCAIWENVQEEGYSSSSKHINYCPMCGVKLRTE